MTAQPRNTASAMLTGIFFLALWLVTILGLGSLYVEFRRSGSFGLLGDTYAGQDAVNALLIGVIVPVVSLAIAIKGFHTYATMRKKLQSAGRE